MVVGGVITMSEKRTRRRKKKKERRRRRRESERDDGARREAEGRGLKGGLAVIVRQRVRKSERVAPRQTDGRARVCKLG